MHQDMLGLTLTTQSADAAMAFDHAVNGYLTYRADGMQRLGALLEADPECGMAHVLKGYFAMLAYKQAVLPMAQQAAADAARCLAGATPREHAHLAALQAWIGHDTEHAAAIWEHILADHPRDIVAFRLAHFVNFWLGRPGAMLASVHGVLPHWSEDLPGYNAILGCLCFANEECGHYTEAEEAGRAAIAREPGDLWSAHGVAHVMEMQGRRGEGLAWLEQLAPHWEGSNNLRHHLWWHAAMFQLERGDRHAVLALYDKRFRDPASPLVEARARPLHRRAERVLDVVAAGAARRRCRRPLDRIGRQGGGTHRRLPVRVHAAALDDGAGRHRAVRCGATHAGGDAGLRPGTGRRCERWSAMSPCRSRKPCCCMRGASTRGR